MERLTAWLAEQEAAARMRRLSPVERLGGGRLRLLAAPSRGPLLDFSSNDYLALSEHPVVIAGSRAALEQHGAGAGAARLMSGDLGLHHELEAAVARLKGQEAALLFGSGYLANAGVLPALVGRGDVIFSDRLNHASIYDGCRLSGARLVRFRHNDCNHLEELLGKKRGVGRALLIVESIYSMDGDRAPLADLVALKERFDCLLMVDEAHATGLFGASGGGVIEEEGLIEAVDVAMGTFGKALGSYGAYVAGSRLLIDYLVNRARSFIFSTALPPAVAGASLAALTVLAAEPELRDELWDKVAHFKARLQDAGLAFDLGPSQIVPITVGESDLAVEAAARLRAAGVYATAVRPPTVPEHTARLRFSVTRHHSPAVLAETAHLIGGILSELMPAAGG